jgi:hypothetical protein
VGDLIGERIIGWPSPSTTSIRSILSAVNTVNLVNTVNAVKYTPPSGGVATRYHGCQAPVSLLASSVVNPSAIIDTIEDDQSN